MSVRSPRTPRQRTPRTPRADIVATLETKHSTDEMIPEMFAESKMMAQQVHNTAEGGNDGAVSGFWSVGMGLPPLKKFTKGEMWQSFEYNGKDHVQNQYVPVRTQYVPFHPKPTLFANVEFDTAKSCPSDVVACSNLPRGFAFLGFHDTKRENFSPRKAAMPKVRKVVDAPPPRFSTRTELLAHRKQMNEAPHLQNTYDLNAYDAASPKHHKVAQFTEGKFGFNKTRNAEGKPLGATRLCV